MEDLQARFIAGKTPTRMNGFYRGKLEKILPATLAEKIGAPLLRLYLPWRGKYFYGGRTQGDNVITPSGTTLLRLLYGKSIQTVVDAWGNHFFPFQTSVASGIKDSLRVLRLDYDLDTNPPTVRTVVDELVMTAPGEYLGKAFRKRYGVYRLVAYFSLTALSN